MPQERNAAYRRAEEKIEQARRSGAKALSLSGMRLTEVPEALWKLTALQELSLSSNQLTTLPEAMGKLTALQTLSLHDNQLTTLPEALWKLTALRELWLNNNQFSMLPEALGKLTALQELRLDNNQLTTLPVEIGQLTALTQVDVRRNQLTELPDEIGNLTRLKELYLGNNQLKTLPASLCKLTQLLTLYLGNNPLLALPECMRQLTQLRYLSLGDNPLGVLPDWLGQLAQLRWLFLSGSQLTALPKSLLKLTKLERLFLHGNPALGLPAAELGPAWNKANKENPPAKPAAILDYYFSIRGSAGRALREVKLIFVGRGEVGKSSMVDVLQGKPFVEKRGRTDGIAISPWVVALADGEAKVQMWDFGGQEILHGTHQFFLTHRSLYVVMVDGRHDRARQDAEYWLKLVRAFGGESPVMVVMNRQKAHPFDMDRQYLADKYGVALEHFFRTDCERAADIPPLREAILEEVAQMLSTEEKFPKEHWEVKVRLEEMKAHGEDWLSEERYADICDKHGLADAEVQGKLLRRLADLGTVVSFPDDVKLAEFSVLNPEWATDGIYRVVTNEPLREKKHGQLRCASLRELLPKERWPKPRHLQFIVELMKKFELCFAVDGGEDTVLVPELLPDKTPPLPDWAAAQCVVFQYKYTVLPHGVLPRFITRTHALSEGRERWRTGVVLGREGAEALVKADYDANTVNVWVRGPHPDARRALLSVVREHFESAHGRIKDLRPEELVALKGHPAVLLPYWDLVKDERRGKAEVPVTIDGERTDRPIGDFLDSIAPPAERRKAAEEERREGRGVYVAPGATYHEHHQPMNDDHSIHARDITNSQVGQTLTNCNNMIQQQEPGEKRDLLETLQREAEELIAKLPEEKKEEAAGNLELMVKATTAPKANRAWYSVSAEGLLEASKFAKGFAGNIVGTVGQLGKLLWQDFKSPGKE